MTVCSVVGCSTRSECIKDSNVSLHRFPKERQIREAWAKALNRLNWRPSECSRICSKHFEEKYIIQRGIYRKLHKEAMPTIFPSCPSSYHKKKAKLRMDEEAARNTHIVQVVPIASENSRESEQDDVSKGEVSDIPTDEESDVSDSAESDVLKDEESNIDEDEEEITENEGNYPLTEENCAEKAPDSEFLTYVVCGTNQQLPNLSQDHCVALTNNLRMENRSKMKDIISNVFQIESQVQAEENYKNRELLFKLSSLENKLTTLQNQRENDEKKIELLLQSQRLNMEKVETLNENIALLQQKLYAAHKSSEMLEAASPFLVELLNRLKKQNKDNMNSRNSEELSEFLKKLYTISPTAYSYIDNYLILSLPRVETLTNWETSDNSAFSSKKK